ncbi:helix-turn-helix transcriptional regulator [Bremerella sp. JC770]|uniref:helix-turn-helix transcriptional regulator n=1 Tax=Bremerella sp. JC770 TaxID=3232137 RepID=UPI00345757DC
MREIHIISPATEVTVVRSSSEDQRSWLADSPICLSLSELNILHCGIMDAVAPLEIVRTNLSGTFFFACFGGEGLVLIDGEWRKISSGQACVQPPFIPNAIKAIDGSTWQFCWVRYEEVHKRKPLVSIHSPSLGAFDVEPFRLAVNGLHAEVRGRDDQVAVRHWIELVHGYVLGFANPLDQDDRLIKLWADVEKRLDEHWTLASLAQVSCMSQEHLRRLCLASLGRSPMQHVTFLRMQKGAMLLRSTNLTVEAIAHRLGYSSPFAFSNAFQRWFSCRPSHFRG